MIEMNKSNFKDYLPLNIIAFSYANGGAQGEPGGIQIVDNDGRIFHFNYADGDLSRNEVFEICPPLKEGCEGKEPEGWHLINMGMGNTLFVNKSIFQQFKEETKDIKNPSQYYGAWRKVVLNIIKK